MAVMVIMVMMAVMVIMVVIHMSNGIYCPNNTSFTM